MTVRQKSLFSKQMGSFKSDGTSKFIKEMKKMGVTMSTVICGCPTRNKHCIPCSHMLCQLYEVCEKEIKEEEEERQLVNNIEVEMLNSGEYGDDDENMLENLQEQNEMS